MATGYNILLPNGSVSKVKAENTEQRLSICDALLNKWNDYCEKNWLSVNFKNPFSPQNKVKNFLSSLGYFLLTGYGGQANGILTRYKGIMLGKRQIPVSSCPSYVEDTVYGKIHTGGQGTQFAKDQDHSFNEYMKYLDERAEKSYKKKPSRKKKPEYQLKSDRISSLYSEGVDRLQTACVDTEGAFQIDGIQMMIDMDRCLQYAPKTIGNDVLYDMDQINRVVMKDGTERFFDQDFNEINVEYIRWE